MSEWKNQKNLPKTYQNQPSSSSPLSRSESSNNGEESEKSLHSVAIINCVLYYFSPLLPLLLFSSSFIYFLLLFLLHLLKLICPSRSSELARVQSNEDISFFLSISPEANPLPVLSGCESFFLIDSRSRNGIQYYYCFLLQSQCSCKNQENICFQLTAAALNSRRIIRLLHSRRRGYANRAVSH